MFIPSFELATPSEIGNEIRRLRHAAGLLQSDLAEASGVSRQWLIKLERGHRRAELWKVLAVVRALECHIKIYSDES